MGLSSAVTSWTDPDTATLVDAVQDLSGLDLLSFHGCYQGLHFSIE